MANNNICPFFGKDDDVCDVGCGYISPHDVRMMVAYCNNRCSDCMKYRELVDRFPEHAAAVPAPEQLPPPPLSRPRCTNRRLPPLLQLPLTLWSSLSRLAGL